MPSYILHKQHQHRVVKSFLKSKSNYFNDSLYSVEDILKVASGLDTHMNIEHILCEYIENKIQITFFADFFLFFFSSSDRSSDLAFESRLNCRN